MIWLGYFFLIFIGLIGLFLLVLLFSKTWVAARAHLDAQKKNLLVEAFFFFRVLKFQFQLEGEDRKIFFTLGGHPLFGKNLAGKKQPGSEKKPAKSVSKKKPSARRQIKLLKSGWGLLENFLRRFFKSLHGFQISGNLSNPTMSFRVPFILICNHFWKATPVFICVRAVSSQFAYACFFRLLCVMFVPFSFHCYFFLVIVSIVCPSINSC